MGKIEGISIGVLGLIVTVAVYAMDWQREQDKKLSDLDKLIDRQKTLLEMQVKFNEEKFTRIRAYGYAPAIPSASSTSVPQPNFEDK